MGSKAHYYVFSHHDAVSVVEGVFDDLGKAIDCALDIRNTAPNVSVEAHADGKIVREYVLRQEKPTKPHESYIGPYGSGGDGPYS